MKKIDLLIKKGIDFLKNSATVLFEIPKKTNKNIFLAFVLLIAFNTSVYSQCSYTALTNPNPKVGEDYTFCIDNVNTIATPAVHAGQYVVVNVVQGFNYTFSVGDIFTSQENLTLFNAENNSNNGLGTTSYNSGNIGAYINWTSTFSGKVKIQLSRASCDNTINDRNGSLTLKLNNIGNKKDDQTLTNTDKWIGHVYNLSSGTGIPPGGNSSETPTASDPFVNSNYVGYYSTANEEINEGFGGDNACFLVTSAATTIYTEKFAVRYRMNSKRPAGYYFINVTGDDGVRAYVDGVLVVNEWREQGATSYCDNLIYLNGNSNLILDYYENGGQNVVKFTLKPFVENNNPNIITGSTSYNLCSGSSPGTLSANPYTPSCGANPSRPNVGYQWQTSSDNVLWTDINSAGNLQNYDVPALSPLTNTVRYYRRLVKSRGSNDATGGVVSNIITVNTNAATVGGAVNGGTTICSGVSSGVLTLSGQTGNVVRWESAPNASGPWSPIPNTNSTYISGPLTQTTLFRAVVQNGACAVATSSSTTVTVNPAPLLTTQPTALTICENTSGSFSVVTSATNPTYQWQYSKDNTNWTNISATLGPNATNYTTATVTFSNTPFAYNGYYIRCLVSASTSCTTISNAVLLTVNPKLSAPTIGTVTQPTCSTATGSTVLNGLPVGSWLLTRNPGNVTIAGTGTSATITGLVAGTSYTFSVNSFTNGLKADYFKNITLGGPPTLTRTDPTINFDWGNGSPDTVIPVDGFSARWSGLVQPIYSENYTFSTLSDDGIRLWVNGVKLIDNWNDHSPITNTGSILLTAGVKYDIILEYYENAGGAVSKLSWSSTSQSLQIIPTAQLFTVSGCDSPPSANVVINPQPATPDAPTVTTTTPTCSIQGTAKINNYIATNSYIFSPTGPTVGNGGVISGLVPGTSYTVTTTDGNCTSVASASFSVAAKLTTPEAPTVTTTAPTCSIQGTAKINNYIATNSYIFSPTGPTVGNGGVISGLEVGTNYTVTTGNGSCISPTSSPFKVEAQLAASSASVSIVSSTSDAVCAGSSVTFTALPTNGGTLPIYQWQLNNTDIIGANSSTYTTTDLTNNDKINVVMISNASPCSIGSPATSNVVTIVVKPIMIASVSISVPTNIICEGTPSSFTFTASPTHGGTAPSYQWKVNGNNKGDNSSVFATTELLKGDVITVEMTSNDTSCLLNTHVTSESITIETKTTLYKNITGWTIEPTPTLSAEIQANYSSSVNLEVCALKITNNAVVKINTGNYFKIQNDLDVSTGTLTVESDANLIQVNPIAVNKGIITVKRDLKFSAARQQYNYLISPVKNVSLTDIYKNAEGGPVKVPFVLYHNEANNKFYNSSGAYIAGRALAVKEATAAAFPVGAGPIMKATFTGEPVNGNLPYTLVNSKPEDSNRGFNLIGNPYPSNLDLDAFYNENAEHLSPTFNFWDSTANDTYIQAGDGYPGQAYAQWNAATPPGEGSGTKATGDITSTKEPTGFVKVGQGFMARTTAASKIITFKNTMRSKEVSQGFFGKGARGAVPFDRYWLNMTSPSNITSQIAMVYFEGGDNGYTKEDSRSLGGSDAIYSIVEGQQISINGKNSCVNTDVQPLGSKHFVSGNYTIALGEQLDGVFANGQSIYLKDKQVGIITNLSQGSYTFAANAGESTGRFEIIYQPETVLATDGVTKENLLVYRDGSDFVVKSSTKKITSIQVLDTSGRLILSLQPNEIMARIKADSLSNGIYFLRIEQGNQVSAKKIIK
ncbi:PA14 domain-containing protein [Kaistella sp. 97-N-M2]|uniref:PA14 domain-containing protein n=1 Tax=Kaistella sp. 97-N-M2 TaxID=2908645 RepID=UPI001F483FCC|nr:PA14 domain-containing protein [Kaistella sp. 97-N-M2]UJF28802.1 PA14 domain-containing protein [Kaistella sp. 97-N-M2]